MTAGKKITVDHLAYVHYEHDNLDAFRHFAKDFGLVETHSINTDTILYFHGYGKDPITYIASRCVPGVKPKFKGAGFVARTKQDFDKACRLPGATIRDASNRPGGGQVVLIRDPNGYSIEIVWGQQEKPVTAKDASSSTNNVLAMNGAIEKQRLGTHSQFKVHDNQKKISDVLRERKYRRIQTFQERTLDDIQTGSLWVYDQ
jgi:catechol 2,3-dioxygenase-like lactoylglutathione lyase family enzyme